MENIRFLRIWQLLGVLFWLAFSVAASKTVSALFWTPRHMVLELRAGSRVPQFFTINPCLAFGPLQICFWYANPGGPLFGAQWDRSWGQRGGTGGLWQIAETLHFPRFLAPSAGPGHDQTGLQ